MKKHVKLLIGLIVLVLVVSGISLKLSSQKSITETLQSEKWSFTDTEGDGLTVQFNDKAIQLGELGSVDYKVDESKKTISFTDNTEFAQNPHKKFSIKKEGDSFILEPLNTDAKSWGTVTLTPKK